MFSVVASLFLVLKFSFYLNELIGISLLSFLKCHFKRSILSDCPSPIFNLATCKICNFVKLRTFDEGEISFSVRHCFDKLITFLYTNLPCNRPPNISASLPYTFENALVSQQLLFSESQILESSSRILVSKTSFKRIRL